MHLRISQSSQAGFSPKYIFKIFYQPSLLVYQNAILRILVDFLSGKQMSPFVGADPFTGAQRPSNSCPLCRWWWWLWWSSLPLWLSSWSYNIFLVRAGDTTTLRLPPFVSPLMIMVIMMICDQNDYNDDDQHRDDDDDHHHCDHTTLLVRAGNPTTLR